MIPLGSIPSVRSRPPWLRLLHSQPKPKFSANYFLDTEFSQGKTPSELISIGITSEDGRDFYAVSNEFDKDRLPRWVKDNVIPRLGVPEDQWISRRLIRRRLNRYLADDPEPHFFAKGSKEDWRLLCSLYGKSRRARPPKFPADYVDVDTLARQIGNRNFPAHPGNHHNALADAKWVRIIWQWLQPQLPTLN